MRWIIIVKAYTFKSVHFLCTQILTCYCAFTFSFWNCSVTNSSIVPFPVITRFFPVTTSRWVLYTEPGIDSKKSIPPAYVAWRASMTNRVRRQADSIPWNRFLGFFKNSSSVCMSDCFRIKITGGFLNNFITIGGFWILQIVLKEGFRWFSELVYVVKQAKNFRLTFYSQKRWPNFKTRKDCLF